MSSDTFYEEPQLINSLVSFEQDADGRSLYVNETQEIPDSFLSDLADKRNASTNERANDFYQVASVPIAVVDHLLTHYGFDVMTAPVRETLAMLKRLELGHFLATQKRI
jgi:hypothetical protein